MLMGGPSPERVGCRSSETRPDAVPSDLEERVLLRCKNPVHRALVIVPLAVAAATLVAVVIGLSLVAELRSPIGPALVLLLGLLILGRALRSGLSDTAFREDGIQRGGHPLDGWRDITSYRFWEEAGPRFSLSLVVAIPMGLATETELQIIGFVS